MRIKKTIWTGVVAICAITVWTLGSLDSHRTNAHYLGWKIGILPFDQAIALKYINVDIGFRRSLEGKTPEELARWFPDLRVPERANPYQKQYNDSLRTKEFLWIGDSAWAMVFRKGRLVEFMLLKG